MGEIPDNATVYRHGAGKTAPTLHTDRECSKLQQTTQPIKKDERGHYPEDYAECGTCLHGDAHSNGGRELYLAARDHEGLR